MTYSFAQTERRLKELEKSEIVPLQSIAALVEKLEQGQAVSAEAQAAAWTEALSALLILLHAGVHAIKCEADCGNEGCALNDEQGT